MLRVFAPAKLNLFLHVTGKRQDGYHLLDSLVCFADTGDELILEAADRFEFTIEGPFSSQLSNDDISENTVVKAAYLWAAATGKDLNVKITLIKNLPSGAGIGGGSADAAATLRALQEFWSVSVPEKKLHDIALNIGSDVPVCLESKSVIMQGTGDILLPAPELQELFALLIWPGQKTPTPDVFKNRSSAFSGNANLKSSYNNTETLIDDLTSQTRNDLELSATELFPIINDALNVLKREENCLFVRMSGSGSTVFGIFKNQEDLDTAAKNIRSSQPNWWVQPCRAAVN